MKEIYNIVKDKELVVRKKIASIIEKMLRHLGYDFLHDRYKEIVYSESKCVTEEEHYIKNLYDGFIYLLNNKKTTITNNFLKKFLYIITDKIYDDYLLSSIAKYYFDLSECSPIEQAVDMNIYIYQKLINEKDILLISYMFFSLILVKHDIPCIQITRKYIIKYEDLLKNNKKEEMYSFIYKLIIEAKYMDKTYYQNLTPLTYDEIYKTIKGQEAYLKEEYKVEGVVLYGSFVKGINRYDSDIDLLVKVSGNMTYEMKKKKLENMKEYLTNLFNRFVDIVELGSIMSDSLLIELTQYKKII